MLISFFSRYSKAIAWFFAFILYGEMLFAMAAKGRGLNSYNFLKREQNRYFSFSEKHAIPVKEPGNDFSDLSSKTSGIDAAEKKFKPGPTQPEMQSFQSVNANNMVDLFSGDFSYNIPLLDVGGYPVNLHYQSGITMDQEASWVGLGWNINPGTITRNMRGLPDDFDGTETVSKTLSMKENKTLGVTIGGNAELFGKSDWTKITETDSVLGRSGTLGLSAGVFHNTYKGWGTEFGLNAGINSGATAKGPLSGGLSVTNSSQDGLDISPSLGFRLSKEDAKTQGNVTIGTNYNSRLGIQSLQLTGQVRQHVNDEKKVRYSQGISSSISFARPSFTPAINIPFSSTQFSYTVKVGAEAWAFHPNMYVRGYGSVQKVVDTSLTLPAFGYLYYQKAKGESNVLLDFNREKDISYSNKTPHIAIPVYTYDTYTITGEGTGGMFRPYRGDVGYVYDHAMATKSTSNRLSIDLGFGAIFHGGVDLNLVSASTRNSPWLMDNAMKDVIGFKDADSTYENVYFKNPGEKTLVDKNYYDAIGDDKLVRVNLFPADKQNTSVATASRMLSLYANAVKTGQTTLDLNTRRKQRDKRTQVISYLNAEETANAGLDRVIKSYHLNSFPSTTCFTNYDTISRLSSVRLKNHISEITVLNPDGRRYVYGVPVYNVEQQEVSFSIDNTGDTTTGLVSYTPGQDNSVNNNKGKEGYYSREVVPAYAHSFLLSGILSGDYVDVTNDGISEDDQGDAVKFNYSQIYSQSKPFRWRAPFDASKASYNESLKTDSRDQRASYTYGKREVWYLNSIESKTMIATFKLDTDNTRKDGYGVNDENGGRDNAQKLYSLKEINLYAKADYLKNGANAKPVKTVRFEYDYSLCRKSQGSVGDSGKLTLKKVWFTYNKNDKGKLNPYVFTYKENPDYNSRSVDRWGNYKDSKNNPGNSNQELTNADYPYTIQKGVKSWNADSAAKHVAAWTLSKIKLPSGASIDVTYESDDYAYVQDKRAMQFFEIAGFGASSTATPSSNLYLPYKTGNDYRYVFINVSQAVTDKKDIAFKYLQGVDKLYFKLLVRMPDDKWGKGYEYVPCYAGILDYGIKGNPSDKKIWIRIDDIKGESPLAVAAIQFLRLNLASKAYKFSEPGDRVSIKEMAGMFASIAGNVQRAIKGFGNDARTGNKCNSVLLQKSFVRLNSPEFKKYGGGLRVQKIVISDNWNSMTQKQESTYGMQYDYTTTEKINGVLTRVSSGVATYEPSIGNDENPFHLPIEFTDKVGVLAPTDYLYTEYPFCETFFPGASVGYSKVTVQTMHKDKKSATGTEETEFYTAREFPTITEFTPLDNESKKTYNPAINNVLKFDAKHYVTLSQGFKIELNDMHGKIKSQSSYAANDTAHPISYTSYYYKQQNDLAIRKKLSGKVSVADSASGVINTNAEIGKDVEIMVDIREQKSTTISGSLEANVDVMAAGPFVIGIPRTIPLPSSEVDRYRSIAVMKVVNRYGILDSVIHFEKGSKVSTRNLVYDSETGDVVLSQTNNEFDDPVYNFNYPAHWAYSGMGPAYRNIGLTYSKILFRQGKMFTSRTGAMTPVPESNFESGDELLVYATDKRIPFTNDTCSDLFYMYFGNNTYQKLWAMDAAKGKEAHKGIYFIDKDGKPFSGFAQTIKIIRSGKRNLSSAPVGTITSLKNPVRVVNSVNRFVFDSTGSVINASAARFRDFWRVDSTNYRKDTIFITKMKADTLEFNFSSDDRYGVTYYSRNKVYVKEDQTSLFEAYSYRFVLPVSRGAFKKSWLRFDLFTPGNYGYIPKGAVIKSAILNLPAVSWRPHKCLNGLLNNYHIQRVIGPWIRQRVERSPSVEQEILRQYFEEINNGRIDPYTKVTVSGPINSPRSDLVDITNMVQAMTYDYYTTNGVVQPSVMIRLENYFGGSPSINPADTAWNRVTFGANGNCKFDECTKLRVIFYRPCADSTSPTFDSLPSPGFYCYSQPKDSFICKPNINDTAVNPYRYGILGNWRVDRAYTYYGDRNEPDPLAATNIRTNGEIKSFMPYWNFTNALLSATSDSSRWVWNSEMTLFNRKGYEIENRDPLNRYNSGQYGYNQTLPVAVIQNSRNREMMFDGFEDYNYRTDTCKQCQTIRFADLAPTGVKVDSVSHSGKYSLRLPGNQTTSSSVIIGTLAADTATANLSAKIDSTVLIRKNVNGNGNGLTYEYRSIYPLSSGTCKNWNSLSNSNIDIDWGLGSPGTCTYGSNYFETRWRGRIQPKQTGTYRFYAIYDDDITIKINNKILTDTSSFPHGIHNWNAPYPAKTITLEAGIPYTIEVNHREGNNLASAHLFWEINGQREIVPVTQLYPIGSDSATIAAATVTTDTAYCIMPRNVKPAKITLDRFSPLQGTKLVVSAWVRQEVPCITGDSTAARIELEFNAGSSSFFSLKAKGNIIEGWQRIEDTLTIPASATSVTVRFKSTSSNVVYFDDVRIHPFNSNMKSFVYDPISLRLMAELDENNYATFYEYDDDGTLIRVKKETERGIKTIKETRSALFKEQ